MNCGSTHRLKCSNWLSCGIAVCTPLEKKKERKTGHA